VLATSTWIEDDWSEFPGTTSAPVPAFSTTIGIGDCETAQKLAPKKVLKPILLNVVMDELSANGTVKFAGTDLDRWNRMEAQSVEGTFPNYRCAMPKAADLATSKAEGRTVKVSLEWMALAIQAMQKIHGKDAMVDMAITTPDRPIHFLATTDGIITEAIVMPLVESK
jgi:hypothetical protein